MGKYLPPYVNKHLDKLKKDIVKAERKALKAKKAYEFSQEYLALCKEQFATAKDEK